MNNTGLCWFHCKRLLESRMSHKNGPEKGSGHCPAFFFHFHFLFFFKAFMKDICSLIRVRILISFVKARGRRVVLVLYSCTIKWSFSPSQLAFGCVG